VRFECERLFKRPPRLDTVFNGASVRAHFFGPVSYAQSFAKRFVINVFLTVALLFGRGGPPTVARLVIAIVVDAIKRGSFRALA